MGQKTGRPFSGLGWWCGKPLEFKLRESEFNGGIHGEFTLPLERAPVFLRVAEDRSGNLRAICKLDDAPLDSERVYVYRRDESVKPFRHKEWQYAKYNCLEDQPGFAIKTDQKLWEEWTREHW